MRLVLTYLYTLPSHGTVLGSSNKGICCVIKIRLQTYYQ